jgi:FkbM family methyltransferase
MYIFYYFNNKDLNINVSKNTIITTPHTFNINNGLWEQESIKQFYSNIDNKQYNIIDIGAQSGLYSLYAKFLPNSNFYSFEPFPDTFACLNENLKLNKINNVKTFNIGLSDKKGLSTLNLSKSHNGLHTMGNNPLRFNDINSININTDTLDEMFFNKNIHVHFIKIDTEGWEYYILKGGEKTIKKYKPIIQLEWNIINMKQCNVTENDLINLLKSYGYYEKSMVEEEKLFVPI